MPKHSLISSQRVSGRVRYAVMSFGGFLGIGHAHYPIPWAALKYDPAVEGYRTGITEDQLRTAPKHDFSFFGDRAWESRVHGHYGNWELGALAFIGAR